MLALQTHPSIAEIDARAWNRLAASGNPFVTHAFLDALERTVCVRAEFGWRAQHLTLHEGAQLVAAAPLYIKDNSHGEYVFDWTWADALDRAGGRYYPKLLCGVPYSPVTGPRLLVGTDANAGQYQRALVAALRTLTDRAGLSSAHVNFIEAAEAAAFDEAWLPRWDWQFHWHNPGDWRDFQDYLDALTHKRRSAVRRERRQTAAAGLSCEFRDGGTLDEGEWLTMHRLYTHTFDEKGNTPTLTLEFFRRIGQSMPQHSHVAFARRTGRIVAGALFLSCNKALYGRYWGAAEAVPGLHFELCYYQGIEYCLRQGLHRFEPGAQGVHKLARGFLPVRTQSRHYLADSRLRAAVRHALADESALLEARGRELLEHTPFAQRAAAP